MTSDPYPDLSTTDLPEPWSGAEPVELDEADSRLLAALSRLGPPVVTAVEDELRTAGGARDDAWASRPAARRDGPVVPVFQEPD